MMWYIQPLLDWLISGQGSNLAFASITLALLLGGCPKSALMLTLSLHVLLAIA